MEKRLGELLIGDKIISKEQFEDAMSQQKSAGDSLVRTFVEMGAVTEWEMVLFIAVFPLQLRLLADTFSTLPAFLFSHFLASRLAALLALFIQAQSFFENVQHVVLLFALERIAVQAAPVRSSRL